MKKKKEKQREQKGKEIKLKKEIRSKNEKGGMNEREAKQEERKQREVEGKQERRGRTRGRQAERGERGRSRGAPEYTLQSTFCHRTNRHTVKSFPQAGDGGGDATLISSVDR